MKRQSKPEKIKKEKSTAPGEWLYFAPANVTVRSIYEVITAAFAKQHGCENVFLVTLKPEEFETAKKAMNKIVASLGGLFCGDTEDFTPVLQ